MAVRLTEATKHDAQGMFIPAECAVRSKVEILAPEHIAAADTFHAIWRAVSKQTATGWAGCQSHGHLDFAPPVLIAVGEDGSNKLALCYRAGRDILSAQERLPGGFDPLVDNLSAVETLGIVATHKYLALRTYFNSRGGMLSILL